jgi:hypothetical protein
MSKKCTKASIDLCSFNYWYPLFSSVSIKSIFIPLPQQVIDYINSDGLVLPSGPNADLCNDEHDDALSDYSNANSDQAEPPSFPLLWCQINECIADLGGFVFPKLNWSSPKDAAWISLDSTLKCDNANDVFLLLKASDFISHDLNYPYENALDLSISCSVDQYFLVLRKWCSLFPSMEFRVFVKNKRIIGICQRDIYSFYDFLQDLKKDFQTRIIDFYGKEIKDKFPDTDCNLNFLIKKMF